MSEFEIALARAYLAVSGQDPIAALVRSVRDLARTRDAVSIGYVRGHFPGPDADGRVPEPARGAAADAAE